MKKTKKQQINPIYLLPIIGIIVIIATFGVIKIYNQNMYSESKPVITLKGDTIELVNLGSEFTDPGVTAKDKIDGNISRLVKVNGEVDTTKEGEYTLEYNVITKRGKKAETVYRIIKVCKEEQGGKVDKKDLKELVIEIAHREKANYEKMTQVCFMVDYLQPIINDENGEEIEREQIRPLIKEVLKEEFNIE